LQRALNTYYNHNPSPRYRTILESGTFDVNTMQAFSLFQQELGAQHGTNGVVGKETFRLLDNALNNTAVAQIPINAFGLIYGTSLRTGTGKAYLYKEPEESQKGKELSLNERVFVKRKVAPGWYEVTNRNHIVGYVKGIHLKLMSQIDDKGATLHFVTEPNLETIIDKYYGKPIHEPGKPTRYDYEQTYSRTMYANAIFYLNRQTNNAVYTEETIKAKKTYHKLQVQKNSWIWIPGELYAKQLYATRKIKSGSFEVDAKDFVTDGYQSIVKFLDDILPVGQGIKLEGALGVTVGFLGGDVETGFYIYRKSKDVIFIQRRAMMAGGLDAGIGAGFFEGDKDAKPKKDGTRRGIGGEVGLGADLKAKTVGYQNFEFPFKNNLALISALITMTYQDKNAKNFLFISLADLLFSQQLSPTHYLVKAKGMVGGEGKILGVARAGIRTGKENFQTVRRPNEYVGDKKSNRPYKLTDKHRLINLFLAPNGALGLQFTGLAGLETQFLDENGKPTHASEARYMDVVGMMEGLLSVDIIIKLLDRFGGGIKQKYRYDLANPDADPVFLGVGVYVT
ncbi:MAG: hypothetical protein AAF734_08390, partial [Bacteroidota bacterium]